MDEIKQAIKDYRIRCDIAVSEWDDGFYTQAEYEKSIIWEENKLLALIASYSREARIDEHTIMNARFTTSRSTSAATDQLSEGYNICRAEWSRINYVRLEELKEASSEPEGKPNE